MSKQPISNDRTDFAVYLEGVHVPFTACRIQETEGAFPSAVISVPATKTCCKILPGTIVQIAGPYELSFEEASARGRSRDIVLLFEGEVVSYAYSKSATGRALQLQCSSLLNRLNSARSYSVDSLAPQMHKNAQMIFVNSGAPVGWAGNTNEGKQEGDEKAETEPDTAEDFTLSNRFGGIHATMMELLDATYQEGDMHTMFQRIFAHFDLTDYYWSMLDLSFRLRGSILAFPNMANQSLSAITAEALKNALALIKQGPGDRSDIYTLYEIMEGIMEMIRYQTISPAAPTATKLLYGTSSDNYEPLRMTLCPDLDAAPPAMCNVFYPEHVISFNMSRSFFSEPTRSISYMDWSTSKAGAVGLYGINFLIPNLSVYQTNWKPKDASGESGTDEILDYSAAFTAEESYQGARPIFTPLDGWMTQAANDYYDQKDRTIEDITEPSEGSTPNWNQSMKNEALKKWMRERYGESRQLTIQTSWNPGRMVGVPGLVIDPGFPTMYGVIQNISTEINAGGSASSSVTFRSVRFIYDEDPEAFVDQTEASSPKAQRVTDMDIFPNIHPFLYDGDLYGTSAVGETVYPYLIKGRASHSNSPRTDYLSDKVGTSEFYVSKSQWDKLEPAAWMDQSILKFIKDEEQGHMRLPDTPWGKTYTDTAEEEYAKFLYYSVKVLKSAYKQQQQGDADGLKYYLADQTYRNLINFNDYLGYIAASNKDTPSDYKTSTTILSRNAKDNLDLILQTASDGAEPGAYIDGTFIEESKLMWGTGSEIANVKWLEEAIAKEEDIKAKLEAEHVDIINQEMAEIEAKAVVASVTQKKVYTIQDGDTIGTIATLHNTTSEVILRLNTVPGEAILDNEGNNLSSGKAIFVPNATQIASGNDIEEQQKQRKATLDAVLAKNIEYIQKKIDRYTEIMEDIKKGVDPNQLIAGDKIEAVYRPYDDTRKAHVISAFDELKKDIGDVNVSQA